MASGINRTRSHVGYGLTNALQSLAQAPIVASRNPTSNDFAEYGTEWVNKSTNAVFVNTGNISGGAAWNAITNGPLFVNGALASSANQVILYSGTGAPTIPLPKGSLYLRVDGSSAATRAYIATDSVGGWTNIVTAA